ncbi:unnamed protein product [Vitrella brassicaformis CCMP3155]|uniref:Uncharacterized protein n=1 Tax=Vitrella brassicaformis (strain CCMP3155) TaxID=1169540 RepID=A0A0G4FKN8_VITBC|nr:unnamed protein product [Vitrella brassicaformis CCMP3155]|eukprot:CEM14554.1 unnamed protein product [Vitrella brassicaformis CCMP3155]
MAAKRCSMTERIPEMPSRIMIPRRPSRDSPETHPPRSPCPDLGSDAAESKAAAIIEADRSLHGDNVVLREVPLEAVKEMVEWGITSPALFREMTVAVWDAFIEERGSNCKVPAAMRAIVRERLISLNRGDGGCSRHVLRDINAKLDQILHRFSALEESRQTDGDSTPVAEDLTALLKSIEVARAEDY